MKKYQVTPLSKIFPTCISPNGEHVGGFVSLDAKDEPVRAALYLPADEELDVWKVPCPGTVLSVNDTGLCCAQSYPQGYFDVKYRGTYYWGHGAAAGKICVNSSSGHTLPNGDIFTDSWMDRSIGGCSFIVYWDRRRSESYDLPWQKELKALRCEVAVDDSAYLVDLVGEKVFFKIIFRDGAVKYVFSWCPAEGLVQLWVDNLDPLHFNASGAAICRGSNGRMFYRSPEGQLKYVGESDCHFSALSSEGIAYGMRTDSIGSPQQAIYADCTERCITVLDLKARGWQVVRLTDASDTGILTGIGKDRRGYSKGLILTPKN